MRRYLAFALFFTVLFTFFSCKNGNKSQTAEPPAPADQLETADMQVFPMPTPYEIVDAIQKAQVPFNPDLLNSPSKISNYVSDLAKEINIGVYGADLSYVNVFGNSQLTLEYFDLIKRLSEDIGLASLFPEDFLKRIENNIENPDSLYKIATETYYKTYSYLYNRGKGDAASIVLAGAFVETLYLAGRSAEFSKKPEIIYNKIAEHRFASQQLMQILDENAKTSKDVEHIRDMVRQIDVVFRKITFVDDLPQYSDEDMKLLLSRVYQIRKVFVEME